MRYLREKLADSHYFSDQIIFVSLAGSILSNIILWVLLISKYSFSSETVPLHFSVVFGIDFAGPQYLVYELPAMGLLFILINFILAYRLYTDEPLPAYFLAGAGLFLQGLVWIGALALINLII